MAEQTLVKKDVQTPQAEQAGQPDAGQPDAGQLDTFSEDTRAIAVTTMGTIAGTVIAVCIIGLALGAARYIHNHVLSSNYGWAYLICFTSTCFTMTPLSLKYYRFKQTALWRINLLINTVVAGFIVLVWIGLIAGIK